MKLLKTVTRRDGFWKALKQECDRNFEDFAPVLGQSLDEDYEVFKANLQQQCQHLLKVPHLRELF